jgi:MFS family permease
MAFPSQSSLLQLESQGFMSTLPSIVSLILHTAYDCASPDICDVATSKKTTDIIGAVTALFAAGAAFGAVIQGWTSDFLGRRKALAVGGIIALFGTALVAGSVNIPMLMVFRFVSGLGVGQLLCLVPLYIAEVAPPKHRGFMSAGTGCSFSFGYLM